MAITFSTELMAWTVSDAGLNVSFVDLATSTNYADTTPAAPIAEVTVGGVDYPATSASGGGGSLTIGFSGCGATVVLAVDEGDHYLTLTVQSVSGAVVTDMTFLSIPTTLTGATSETFAACSLARNVTTRVTSLPGPMSTLDAGCMSRFGLTGASVAIIGCPTAQLRTLLQEAATAAPDLPHSALGGPWALDNADGRGSYVFDYGTCTESTVADWVSMCEDLGFTQVDFHGGDASLRFGDLYPNRVAYPDGYASLTAIVAALHAAGLKAGLHTYSFFIAKGSSYVAPRPDARLGVQETFTLAADVTAADTTITVNETTAGMSLETGFDIPNSVTIWIGNELITYTGINTVAPFAFTGCTRGANGTGAAAHSAGAAVKHLKEKYGLFVPDQDSTLMLELAQRIASVYNACGFDMLYLDALDGGDILAGAEYSWYYEAKFAHDVANALDSPALMEMATMHHGLWCVRSRIGAWDYPTRAAKTFIDRHVARNVTNAKSFLPTQLGWWSIRPYGGTQAEPTFTDDMEYLCAKALGTDSGLSLTGVNPTTLAANPAWDRYVDIIHRYEDVRNAGWLTTAGKAALAAADQEFILLDRDGGGTELKFAWTARHKIQLAAATYTWTATNPYSQQTPRVRVEALQSAEAYTDAGVTVLLSQATLLAATLTDATDVTLAVAATGTTAPDGTAAVQITAANAGATAVGAWGLLETDFSPSVDLGTREAVGVWVYGDNSGAVLNIVLRSPDFVTPITGTVIVSGRKEHYITLDFTGWQYFELVEADSERNGDYTWPTSANFGTYQIYRYDVDFSDVGGCDVWLNNVPVTGTDVLVSVVKALPLATRSLVNPVVTIGSTAITFPVTIPVGSYVSYISATDCHLYDEDGEEVSAVTPTGATPVLAKGANTVVFSDSSSPAARARVTLRSIGGSSYGAGVGEAFIDPTWTQTGDNSWENIRYVMYPLGAWFEFPVQTRDFISAAVTDADALPTFAVYVAGTDTVVATGTCAKKDDTNTTGFYVARGQVTTAGGYVDGGDYTVRVTGTVAFTPTVEDVATFRVGTVPNVPPVAPSLCRLYVNAVTLDGTGSGVPTVAGKAALAVTAVLTRPSGHAVVYGSSGEPGYTDSNGRAQVDVVQGTYVRVSWSIYSVSGADAVQYAEIMVPYESSLDVSGYFA